MIVRMLLSGFLVSTGLHAGAQAGDNDCVIQFYLGKVGTDGTVTTLMDCVTWLNNEAVVELQPGEEVRLTRHCPGCNACPVAYLVRRVGSGPGHATASDPVLDTLSFTSSSFSAPGSYFLRGIAPDYGMYAYSASLKLIVQQPVTAVGEHEGTAFRAWQVPEGLALKDMPAGMLSVIDMTGKLMHRTRLASSMDTRIIWLPDLPTGTYIILVASDDAILRQRILID